MSKELRQAENKVMVTGLLKEMNLEKKDATIDVNNQTRKTTAIGGDVVISANGKDIKVRMYQKALKKDGTTNGIYAGYETILNEYVSIADAMLKYQDVDLPDDWKTEVTPVSVVGEFRENAFVAGGNLIVDTPVTTTFLNRPKGEYVEKAEFSLEGYFNKVLEEKDSEGEETGRLLIELIVTAYGGRVFPINLVAPQGDVADYLESNYEAGKSGKIWGELDFTFVEERKVTKAGFGKDKVEVIKHSKKELLITGGLEDQYDTDNEKLNLDKSLIKKGMNERDIYFEQLKNNSKNNKGFDSKNNKKRADKNDADHIPF